MYVALSTTIWYKRSCYSVVAWNNFHFIFNLQNHPIILCTRHNVNIFHKGSEGSNNNDFNPEFYVINMKRPWFLTVPQEYFYLDIMIKLHIADLKELLYSIRNHWLFKSKIFFLTSV